MISVPALADERPRREARGARAEQAREQVGAILRPHLVGEGQRERALRPARASSNAVRPNRKRCSSSGIVGGGALALEIALVERGVAGAGRDADDRRGEVGVDAAGVVQVAQRGAAALRRRRRRRAAELAQRADRRWRAAGDRRRCRPGAPPSRAARSAGGRTRRRNARTPAAPRRRPRACSASRAAR